MSESRLRPQTRPIEFDSEKNLQMGGDREVINKGFWICLSTSFAHFLVLWSGKLSKFPVRVWTLSTQSLPPLCVFKGLVINTSLTQMADPLRSGVNYGLRAVKGHAIEGTLGHRLFSWSQLLLGWDFSFAMSAPCCLTTAPKQQSQSLMDRLSQAELQEREDV